MYSVNILYLHACSALTKNTTNVSTHNLSTICDLFNSHCFALGVAGKEANHRKDHTEKVLSNWLPQWYLYNVLTALYTKIIVFPVICGNGTVKFMSYYSASSVFVFTYVYN